MKVIDAVSKSGLFGIGAGTGEYVHAPTAIPRAAVVFALGWAKNALDVTAATYGGTAMTRLEASEAIGPEPFPYTGIWFLDNCPQGPQTVKVTKNANAKVRIITVTLNAGGAVSVDASNGGGGTNAQAAVPKLTAGGNSRLALGVQIAKFNGLPKERSNGVIESFSEGAEFTFDLVGYELPLSGAANLEWTWPEAVVNSRSGVMLSVPGMVEPEGRVFTADGDSGFATQWGFIPALVGRFSVVANPFATSSAYAYQFERREGDALIAGGNRAEANSNFNYPPGTERWFEFWRELVEGDEGHWCLFWQTHDESGGSPPVCLLEENGTLFFGNGAGIWYLEVPAQKAGTKRHYKVFDKVHPTEGKLKLWINGQPQVFSGGGTEKVGINTLGEISVYDKVGIYRATASVGTTKTVVGDYKVSSIETPPPVQPSSTLAMVV